MKFHQWLDRSQPQTLQNAVILIYINTVFGVLMLMGSNFGNNSIFGMAVISYILAIAGIHPGIPAGLPVSNIAIATSFDSSLKLNYLILILLVGGLLLGGLAIANEKKWGYILTVVIVGFDLAGLVFVSVLSPHFVTSFNGFLSIVWEVLLAVLLLHPHSRSYLKIWFR